MANGDFVGGFTEFEAPTCTVYIYVGGDPVVARNICRGWVFETSRCVAVDDVDYVYTGGEEKGVRVTLVNYPRFPKKNPEADIMTEAIALGRWLAQGLHQWSYLVVGPDRSLWYTRKPEHLAEVSPYK